MTATFEQYLRLLSAEGVEYTDGRVVCRPGPSPDQLAARVALFRLLTGAAGSNRAVRVGTAWFLDRGVARCPPQGPVRQIRWVWGSQRPSRSLISSGSEGRKSRAREIVRPGLARPAGRVPVNPYKPF